MGLRQVIILVLLLSLPGGVAQAEGKITRTTIPIAKSRVPSYLAGLKAKFPGTVPQVTRVDAAGYRFETLVWQVLGTHLSVLVIDRSGRLIHAYHAHRLFPSTKPIIRRWQGGLLVAYQMALSRGTGHLSNQLVVSHFTRTRESTRTIVGAQWNQLTNVRGRWTDDLALQITVRPLALHVDYKLVKQWHSADGRASRATKTVQRLTIVPGSGGRLRIDPKSGTRDGVIEANYRHLRRVKGMIGHDDYRY